MAEMSALSRAPNTRPSTASGASRCRIVDAFTSTTGLAAPMTNMAANAGAACGHRQISSSGSAQKQHAHAEVGGQPLRTAARDREQATEDRADAEHGVEVAHALRTVPDDVDRDRDAEHERRTGDDGLRAVDAGDQAEVAVVPDRREARDRLPRSPPSARRTSVPVRRCRRRRGRARLDPDDQRRRPQEGQRVHHEDERHVGDGQQQATECRTDEEGDALQGAGGAVGRGQLSRFVDQGRQQGTLRRAERRAEDGRQRREREHDEHRSVPEDEAGRSDTRAALDRSAATMTRLRR